MVMRRRSETVQELKCVSILEKEEEKKQKSAEYDLCFASTSVKTFFFLLA